MTTVFVDLVIVGEMEFLVTKNHFISVKKQASSATRAACCSDKPQAASSSSNLPDRETWHGAVVTAERVKIHAVLSIGKLLDPECRFEDSSSTCAIPSLRALHFLDSFLQLVGEWVIHSESCVKRLAVCSKSIGVEQTLACDFCWLRFGVFFTKLFGLFSAFFVAQTGSLNFLALHVKAQITGTSDEELVIVGTVVFGLLVLDTIKSIDV